MHVDLDLGCLQYLFPLPLQRFPCPTTCILHKSGRFSMFYILSEANRHLILCSRHFRKSDPWVKGEKGVFDDVSDYGHFGYDIIDK